MYRLCNFLCSLISASGFLRTCTVCHTCPCSMINSRCSKEEDSGSGPGRDADPLSPWRGPQTHSATWHAARLHPQSTSIHTHKHVGAHIHWSLNAACLHERTSNVCFSLQVVIDKHPVRFFVHKRPHVDFFLEVVSVSLWSGLCVWILD